MWYAISINTTGVPTEMADWIWPSLLTRITGSITSTPGIRN